MDRSITKKLDAQLAAEKGTVYKRSAAVIAGLAYPNTYHVGMSNLGLHRIYSLLNGREDTVCERVFLPDEEDLDACRRDAPSLVTLEQRRPLRDLDILAFSVSFEQDYLNVVEMLRLGGIRPLARERGEDDPLLLLGGVCTFFNPEPLAELFDVVVIGEAEEAAAEVIDVYAASRDRGRRDLLRELARLPGVYIPSFYEVLYHPDGTLSGRKPLEPGAPERIAKRTYHGSAADPAATVILTPETEFGGMHLAEMTRGCGRHCRFCMAGYVYLPPRHLEPAAAREQARRADETCGRIGLVGSALSDYPGISDLCDAVQGSLSVSSLRADSLSRQLIERLAASGHKTVSIAPEAGSERLRKVINKGITEAEILAAANLVFGAGILNLKLYFIIGLPTETEEDLEAVIGLAGKVREVQLRQARAAGRIGRITLSVNSFVPKPFTPFQWEPMEEVRSLNRKIRSLEKAVRGIGNMNLIHDLPKWELFQALLSRGDRRVAGLLLAAQERGGDWKAAARELGMDLERQVTRRRRDDEIFPWDFIDIGVRKEYLRNEYQRALEGKYTPPCNVGHCRTCGVCK